VLPAFSNRSGIRWSGFVFCAALLLARPGFADTATNATDLEIKFWEARVPRDESDHVAPTRLGLACLQKARESGDTAWLERAERALREALRRYPGHAPACAALAAALNSNHRFRESIPLAMKAAQEQPNDPYPWGVLGDARQELGDLAGAKTAYDKMMALDPGLFGHSRLAGWKWLKGDLKGALTDFTTALEQGRSRGAPIENLAWCETQIGSLHFRAGRFSEAEARYQSALGILPGFHLAQDHLAELRAARGQFDEAARSYEQLADRTRRPEYFQAVGDVFIAARKPAAAKPWHDRAFAAYTNAVGAGNVHYFHHLASFCADVREDGVEAEKWARRDLEVRQNIYAWDALAWALFWKSDYAGATEAMGKALAHGTKDAHLLAHAGSIFVRANKIPEGKAFMKQAGEVNPHYADFHVHR
jgi:tetratricopeptide (TPR) repeat protein